MSKQENKIIPLMKGKKEKLISLISFLREKIPRGVEVEDLIILEKGEVSYENNNYQRFFKKEEKEYVYLLKEILDCFGDFEEENIELIPKTVDVGDRILSEEECKEFVKRNPDKEEELKSLIRNTKAGRVLDMLFEIRPGLNSKVKDKEQFKLNILSAIIFIRPKEVFNPDILKLRNKLKLEKSKLEKDEKLPLSIRGIDVNQDPSVFKSILYIIEKVLEGIGNIFEPKVGLDSKEMLYMYNYGLYLTIKLFLEVHGSIDDIKKGEFSDLFPLDNDICILVGFIMSEWGMYDNVDDYKLVSKSWQGNMLQKIKTNITVMSEKLKNAEA